LGAVRVVGGNAETDWCLKPQVGSNLFFFALLCRNGPSWKRPLLRVIYKSSFALLVGVGVAVVGTDGEKGCCLLQHLTPHG
jgi:hypothetical protein